MASGNDQMMEMFLFEMGTLIEQLDEILLNSEKSQELTEDAISEIFRIMHTIKGSSAMMELDLISTVTHKLEDSFFLIREDGIDQSHFTELFDLMLDATDFLKSQLEAIQNGDELAEKNDDLIGRAVTFYNVLKGGAASAAAAPAQQPTPAAAPAAEADLPAGEDAMRFEVFFEEDSGMENLRAFMLVNTLKNKSKILGYHPHDIESNPETAMEIMMSGFTITLESELTPPEMQELIEKQMHVSSATLLSEEDAARRMGKIADLSGARYEAHVFFEEDSGMENLRPGGFLQPRRHRNQPRNRHADQRQGLSHDFGDPLEPVGPAGDFKQGNVCPFRRPERGGRSFRRPVGICPGGIYPAGKPCDSSRCAGKRGG